MNSKKIIKDIYGIKYIDLNDSICKTIKNQGSFGRDNKELFILYSKFNNLKKGVVLDIGANIGTFCIPLAKKFPGLLFYAFEVQNFLCKILLKNLKLNNIKNIKIFNYAISDKNYKKKIFMPDYNLEKNLGSFSLKNKFVSHINSVKNFGERKAEINFKKLDSILKNENILFIKSDTELHEYEVFRGAKNLLTKKKPALLFETWPENRPQFKDYQLRIKQTLNFLISKNYKLIRGYRETFGFKKIDNLSDHQTIKYFFDNMKNYDELSFKINNFTISQLMIMIIKQIIKAFSWRIKNYFLFIKNDT